MLSFLGHWKTFIIDLQNIALSFSQSLTASRSVVINRLKSRDCLVPLSEAIDMN